LRVLVTGSEGFIGRASLRYLAGRGIDALGVDVLSTEARSRVDVADPEAVDRVVRDFAPTAVLHLAAFASVPLCEAEPDRALRTNVLGTVNVARAAHRAGARLVIASSAAVYGDRTPVPMSLRSRLQPTNLYGMTKLLAEHVCREYAPNSAFLRLFNVYGEGCQRSYVIPDILRKLSARPSTLHLEGTGKEARDFIYIGDVLRAMELALRGTFRGPFNVGTGVRTSVRALARRLAREVGLPKERLEFAGPRPGDFRVTVADISRGNCVPGWSPEVPLAEGLRRVLSAG
jgi:UDP-glucose 4-epimerase